MDLLKGFFLWFLNLIYQYILEPLLYPLFETIPSVESQGIFTEIHQFYGFVGEWIPTHAALRCLTLYFAFIIVMISVKLIIKLFIPTVG